MDNYYDSLTFEEKMDIDDNLDENNARIIWRKRSEPFISPCQCCEECYEAEEMEYLETQLEKASIK